MLGKNYINQQWVKGDGQSFVSINPANGETVWQGCETTLKQIDIAVNSAHKAFPTWAERTLEDRIHCLNRFQSCLQEQRMLFTETIAKEVGKPLWEADSEVAAMLSKVPIAIEAYHERCKSSETILTMGATAKLKHKPHGVLAVFGPFNFPGHLPNGHIVPALLAGNTIVFKASEHTPLVAETLVACWEKAGLPEGVLNLIQGGSTTGKILAEHPGIQGVLFTGSFRTGVHLSEHFSKQPEKILALEMGGNNPLVVHNVSNITAAVYHTLQSAYITSGQRCTCARRLIVTKGKQADLFIKSLIQAVQHLKIGPYWEKPEPFLGPVISTSAASHIVQKYQELITRGGKELVALQVDAKQPTFLSPGLVDVTPLNHREDEEIFGPLLQLIWVNNLDQAIQEANNTLYGLSSAILCDDENDYLRFQSTIKAGIVNWNRPTTGANSHLPFGGVGRSGNYRPAGFYSADYCSYPVASVEEVALALPETLSPGVILP